MITITLCGSGKQRAAIFEAARVLRDQGAVVLAPPLHRIDELVGDRPEECRELAWKGATFAHLNRIEKADVVFIVNPDGYLGPSTTLELGYAVALRKLVVAMQRDNAELARAVLIDITLDTADVADACKKLATQIAPIDRRD
jgi:nucleoside 2-deoxyribosyltransferase